MPQAQWHERIACTQCGQDRSGRPYARGPDGKTYCPTCFRALSGGDPAVLPSPTPGREHDHQPAIANDTYALQGEEPSHGPASAREDEPMPAPQDEWSYTASSDADRRLLDTATPDLYRTNPFRVTGLPTTATIRDIRRLESRLKIQGKLGMNGGVSGAGYLPLDPPPDEDAIRAAMARLQDPEARLVDELFWFWPQRSGAEEDRGLQLLRENRASDALSYWLAFEKDESVGKASTHNLAVLYHTVALDLEHAAGHRALTENEDRTRAVCWGRACRRWQRLIEEEGFWNRLAARAQELDDPRVTGGTVRRIRESLTRAILLVNARSAVAAAERGNRDTAARHVSLMQGSGYAPSAIDGALAEALAPTRERIRMQCELLTKSDEPAARMGALATELLERTRPHLMIVETLLPAGNATRDAAFDEVAGTAMQCAIAFGNETEDWSACIELLETILPVVASQSMRARVEENLEIVRKNRLADLCYFCEQNDAEETAAIKIGMHYEVSRVRGYNSVHVQYRTATIPVPRCSTCRSQHRRAQLFPALGALFGAVPAGLIAWAAIGGANADPVGWIVGALVATGVGAIGGVLYDVCTRKPGIKSAGASNAFPPIRDLRAAGWCFGNSPST